MERCDDKCGCLSVESMSGPRVEIIVRDDSHNYFIARTKFATLRDAADAADKAQDGMDPETRSFAGGITETLQGVWTDGRFG